MRQVPLSPLSFDPQRVANVPEHPPPSTRLRSCAHIANRRLSRIIGARDLWYVGLGFPLCARRYVYSPLRLKLARYLHIAQLDPHPDWLAPAFQPCIRPRPRLPLGSSADALVNAARPIAHTKSSFFTSVSSKIHPTSVEWDTSVP